MNRDIIFHHNDNERSNDLSNYGATASFSSDTTSLYRGDCLEVMARIPDASVHLICADLPYGTTDCKTAAGKWDVIIPFEPLWEQYRRILTPRGAVVLTASQPFTTLLAASNLPWLKYSMVWAKTRKTGFQHATSKPLKAHEDILVFSPGTAAGAHTGNRQMTYNPQGLVELPIPITGRNSGMGRTNHSSGRRYLQGGCKFRGAPQTHTNYPTSILEFVSHAKKRDEESHPTQKPIALFEHLIRTYSNEGETVLDNCMGSGTTGVAAVNCNRRFVGIERDPGYFQMAQQRIVARQWVAKKAA